MVTTHIRVREEDKDRIEDIGPEGAPTWLKVRMAVKAYSDGDGD